jgi:hypothetical protein
MMMKRRIVKNWCGFQGRLSGSSFQTFWLSWVTVWSKIEIYEIHTDRRLLKCRRFVGRVSIIEIQELSWA